MEAAVGRRLRRLREARGISLSALARSAGIGKATLSGLELGTRNPTLETLYAVAGALGVPLTALVLEPGAPATAAADVRGAAVEATLLEVFDEPGVTFELLRMRVHPGVVQQSPPHAPGVTEHATVHAGVLRAGPAGAPLVAGPGEHISWAADVPHVYGTVGDTPVEATLLIRSPRQ
ncbi:helix-turn-helix domain-containing protein [Dactylosporangium sp. AC04546]|uniref:helix-turn-helix domain-containing protein n=1 Tax=Dactylosporangium sp. AC04546 TaxID=2862460 RepID=UPI001EE11D9B|nr:helix-turn-helix domain-containing protein [Dactylosporangium sp. AC04546]WVK80010.1 helix-turn-helix domain-containing protein [Dactylosporangium sp. AC04546]